MSKLASKTPFDIWTIAHLLAGFVSYWWTSLIIKSQPSIKSDEKSLLLWTCFTGFLLLHTIWELWETTKGFQNFWRSLPKWINPDRLLWGKVDYKGDHWSNCLVDTVSFIGGFWLGYAVIGMPS